MATLEDCETCMRMTEREAREAMKACGWSYLQRMRKGHWYVYAQRHLKTGREERYIGPLASLPGLTAEELKRKLDCA
jgi:hypothetical protein